MKSRPILFTAENAQLVHDGRKTQTRRIIKPQSAILADVLARGFGVPTTENTPVIPCPFGTAGDQLWIKETHAFTTVAGYEKAGQVIYKGTGEKPPMGHRWKPSIHMPRWASRTNTVITEVRAQRLLDITMEDAIAEVECHWDEGVPYYGPLGKGHACAIQAYKRIWEAINGKGSWELNPWVWAITFRKL